MNFRFLLPGVCVGAWLSVATAPARGQAWFESVIVPGDAAPGQAEGVAFHSAGTPLMNESGEVVVSARVIGPGVVTDEAFGFWSVAGGSLHWVAQTGLAMAGLPAGTTVWRYHNGAYPFFNSNNAGELSTIAKLQGVGVDSSNNLVLLAEREGEMQVVARTGDAVPGFEGMDVRYGSFTPSAFNSAGHAAFRADLVGADTTAATNQVLITIGPYGPMYVFRESDPAPYTEPGVVFEDYNAFNLPGLTDAGDMLFHANFTGPGIHGFNDQAAYRATGPFAEIIVRDGDLPPDAVAVSGYTGFGSMGVADLLPIDREGHVAFYAGWQGAAGVVVEGPTRPRVVAYTDAQVPGTVAGTTMRSINRNSIVMNGEGDVAYSGTLQGPDVVVAQNWGVLLREYDGQLGLVAREGDPLPMLGEGYTLGGVPSSGVAMNALGQLLFVTGIDGPNIHSGNRTALFATTPSGELVLVLREGDLFDVNTDPFIEDLQFINHFSLNTDSRSNGVDGRGTVFTNDGRFAFGLETFSQFGAYTARVADLVPGDVTGDGLVDQADHAIIVDDADLAILLANLTTNLPGDTDNDGDVDDSDLGTAFANYTGPVGNAGGKTAAQGDTDGDGDVDDSDLGTSFAGYTGPLGPTNVPEPASVALLALGGLLVARRRT